MRRPTETNKFLGGKTSERHFKCFGTKAGTLGRQLEEADNCLYGNINVYVRDVLQNIYFSEY